MTQNNPLNQYFRVPGLHVTLPSRGAFCAEGELELSMNNELAVYPMAAKDEIWSKNPDGLLNGYSVENIIKSCVPGVKNPRRLPSQDIDYLLLAIKKASYGNTLAISATCPKCKQNHDYECSIDDIMNTARPLQSEYSVRLSDELVAMVRPYDYQATTRTNLAAFEETKLLQSLLSVELGEQERVKVFSDSFKKIATLNLDLITDCVVSIISPQAVVTESAHIREFLENAPRQFINAINDYMEVFKDTGIDRNIELTCHNDECAHVWKTEISFDPSHFFG